MRPVDKHPELQRMLRTLRIVVIALAAGVVLFLAFVAWDHYLGGERAAEKPGEGILTWVAVGLAVMNALTFSVVRLVMLRAARDAYARDDLKTCVAKVQGATIVWCAGLEGAGLLAAVAFFIEGHVLTLALGAFLVFAMLLSIPTPGRVDAWLE